MGYLDGILGPSPQDQDQEITRRMFPWLAPQPPAAAPPQTAPAPEPVPPLARQPAVSHGTPPGPVTLGPGTPAPQPTSPPAQPVTLGASATPGNAPPNPAPKVPPQPTQPAQLGPAAKNLQDFTATPPPAVQPLHGAKKVLDTLGQIFTPYVEQDIRYAPHRQYAARLGQLESAAKGEESVNKAGLDARNTESEI